MNENKNYNVVVGIDFGSSGSGIAYSFMDENKINLCDIPGADTDKKVPTEIILDDNNYILKFGKGCKQFLKEKGLDKGHYFKDIKMHLYHKKKEIKAQNTNKTLPLVIVIQKVLEKLKELSLEQLVKLWNNIDEKKIKWVVTVPAIWGNFEKSIMLEACENLGLINKNQDESLFFALEPEAASIYCSRNGDIKKDFICDGKYYIICDLGGGTGDIVTHLVGCNESLEEIVQSDGGVYGSNEIDKKIFEDLIYVIFGYKDFYCLQKKAKELDIDEEDTVLFEGWCDLESQIKNFKEEASQDKIQNKVKYPICCNVFQDFFNEDILLDDLIKKYNSKCSDNDLILNVKSRKKWIIDFPYKIIYNYICEQSKLICKKIENILNKNKEDIDTIIFVGGYSSNEILISNIKQNLAGKIKTFLYPSKPYLAVMEGAVLFGLNPNIITIRISKYTIGMSVNEKWNESKHSKGGKKKFVKEEQSYKCEGCFSKFIEINQKLKVGENITNSYIMTNPRYCTLRFFQSLKPNPTFIYENEVEKMGEFTLDAEEEFPLDEREIDVCIKFGGTFFDVKAMHKKSQKYINGTLHFNEVNN